MICIVQGTLGLSEDACWHHHINVIELLSIEIFYDWSQSVSPDVQSPCQFCPLCPYLSSGPVLPWFIRYSQALVFCGYLAWHIDSVCSKYFDIQMYSNIREYIQVFLHSVLHSIYILIMVCRNLKEESIYLTYIWISRQYVRLGSSVSLKILSISNT